MSVTFVYDETTVTLRNPTLGNVERVNIKTQFRRSMSGDIHSFKKTPNSTVLTLNFSNILHADLLTFIDFLLESAGQVIAYTDHTGQAWTGYILTGPMDIVTQTHIDNLLSSDSCKQDYSFSLDFEGTRDE